jgi:glucose-6-phosphate 1-dehydrogenase
MTRRHPHHPVSPAGTEPAPPCTVVIFGAGGDLTKRLLMPAFYDLADARLLDPRTRIVGVDHNAGTARSWAQSLGRTIRAFVRDKSSEFHARVHPRTWSWVAERLDYLTGDFDDGATFAELAKRLAPKGGKGESVIFYLAVSARFFGPIVEHLAKAGLLAEPPGFYRRVVIEKPFGSDLATARALNHTLLRAMTEDQIYRIDHFLGKETVQNILALRFGNGTYEPIWNREYIDHVQITAAETIGVEKRGAFYEATGALRDMVPNHLFQLASMIGLEAPVALDARAVRDEKVKWVRAVEPLRLEAVVRGQYRAGRIGGGKVAGYRQEPDVSRHSRTETYVALKLAVESWRWAGVPFYLRTGKRLGTRRTEIAVFFKPVPYRLFRETPTARLKPNILRLQTDPAHAVKTQFNAKVPGPAMLLAPVVTTFTYGDFFPDKPNVGYETLLYDCMVGNPLLFQRADAIEESWAVVDPVLKAWAKARSTPAFYAAGSDGPAAADELLRRDGRAWLPLAQD